MKQDSGCVVSLRDHFLKALAGAIVTIMLLGCAAGFAYMFGFRITSLNIGPVSLGLEAQSEQAAGNLAQAAPDIEDNNSRAVSVASENIQTAECPYDNDAFLMGLPYTWYYEPGNSGFAIMWGAEGFAVYDPNYYGWNSPEMFYFPVYQEPQVGVWFPLQDTSFEACVGSQQVFARFND